MQWSQISAQVDQLQLEHEDMKTKLSYAENTMIDLRCRSMRDNLIFMCIK